MSADHGGGDYSAGSIIVTTVIYSHDHIVVINIVPYPCTACRRGAHSWITCTVEVEPESPILFHAHVEGLAVRNPFPQVGHQLVLTLVTALVSNRLRVGLLGFTHGALDHCQGLPTPLARWGKARTTWLMSAQSEAPLSFPTPNRASPPRASRTPVCPSGPSWSSQVRLSYLMRTRLFPRLTIASRGSVMVGCSGALLVCPGLGSEFLAIAALPSEEGDSCSIVSEALWTAPR
jgi:hypothetical protein